MPHFQVKKTLGASPGALRHPQHQVRIGSSDECWRASLDGVLLAESEQVLTVDETGYAQVIYFPPEDVALNDLGSSDSVTTCPFKGEAHYFSAKVAGKVQDVAWYYPLVYDEVMPIQGYVAFYADRVSLTSESDQC